MIENRSLTALLVITVAVFAQEAAAFEGAKAKKSKCVDYSIICNLPSGYRKRLFSQKGGCCWQVQSNIQCKVPYYKCEMGCCAGQSCGTFDNCQVNFNWILYFWSVIGVVIVVRSTFL